MRSPKNVCIGGYCDMETLLKTDYMQFVLPLRKSPDILLLILSEKKMFLGLISAQL